MDRKDCRDGLLDAVAGHSGVGEGPTTGRAAVKRAFPIPTVQRMLPADLNRLLRTPEAEKPLVLQVGSRVMYDQARIPGADYAGPGSTQQGLKLLHDRVAKLPRRTLIVIYCGCCPLGSLPEYRPRVSRTAPDGIQERQSALPGE